MSARDLAEEDLRVGGKNSHRFIMAHAGGAMYYVFLRRGSGLGSAYEAGLLWEEGAKSPATAMGTASFRHGPQEMVTKDTQNRDVDRRSSRCVIKTLPLRMT